MPSRHLVWFVVRATPLSGFIPAGALAVVLGIVAGRQPAGAEFRFLPLRLAVVSIVVAVGIVFDDPAKTFSDPAASPLRLRRGVRAFSGLVLASCIFAIVLLPASADMDLVRVMDGGSVASTDMGEDPVAQASLPWGRPTLEMATMIGLSLAIAAAFSRRGEAEPGRISAGIVLGAYALSWMIPETYKPWAAPLDQRWVTSANWWWVALLVVWVSALILSWDSRSGESGPLGQFSVRRWHQLSGVGSTEPPTR